MKKGYIWGFLAPMFWGIVYVFDGKVLGKVSAETIVFLQALLSVIITLPFVLYHRQELSVITQDRQLSLYLIVAVVAGFFATYSIFASIQVLSVVPAAFLEISYPLFIILFSMLFFGEGVKPQVLLGGLCILMGSLLIVLYKK